MKLKTLGILTVALAFAPLANAETINGTVTSVDGQKVTILRADNNESTTIFVRDRNSLANLNNGSRVSLDANKRFMGGWEASSLDASGALSTAVTSNTRSNAPRESGISTSTSTGSLNSSTSLNSSASTGSLASRNNSGIGTSVNSSVSDSAAPSRSASDLSGSTTIGASNTGASMSTSGSNSGSASASTGSATAGTGSNS